MITEVWKDIPWYEWKYQVSNFGNIMSINYNRTWKQKLLMGGLNTWWYKHVCLRKEWIQRTLSIHRLVSMVFIPNPESKTDINHTNGIKTDNRVENLEWATRLENNQHAYNIWLMVQKKWAYNKKSKPVSQLTMSWLLVQNFAWIGDANRELWIRRSDISKCCKWKVKSAWWFRWEYL